MCTILLSKNIYALCTTYTILNKYMIFSVILIKILKFEIFNTTIVILCINLLNFKYVIRTLVITLFTYVEYGFFIRSTF